MGQEKKQKISQRNSLTTIFQVLNSLFLRCFLLTIFWYQGKKSILPVFIYNGYYTSIYYIYLEQINTYKKAATKKIKITYYGFVFPRVFFVQNLKKSPVNMTVKYNELRKMFIFFLVQTLVIVQRTFSSFGSAICYGV